MKIMTRKYCFYVLLAIFCVASLTVWAMQRPTQLEKDWLESDFQGLLGGSAELREEYRQLFEKALLTAAENGDLQRAVEAIEASKKEGFPVNINARDANGRTPVILLAMWRDPYQLEGDEDEEDIEEANRHSDTQMTFMKRLLNEGADINARDKKGNTPLLYAAGLGSLFNNPERLRSKSYANVQELINERLVDFLLTNGADSTEYKHLMEAKKPQIGRPNQGFWSKLFSGF
jgi:hypothetical protein